MRGTRTTAILAIQLSLRLSAQAASLRRSLGSMERDDQTRSAPDSFSVPSESIHDGRNWAGR